MKIQIRIRSCVFQIPVPFPLCIPLKLQMFKANKRNELVRRTKLIIETDRLSRYVGYNMQAPLVGGSGLWGALCYHCKASIGAAITCPHCGYMNENVDLLYPPPICVEKTVEFMHDTCAEAIRKLK